MPEATKVLVTGGAGFLGRAALRALKGSGADVVATTRGAVPEGDFGDVTWVRADLTDRAQIEALCATHKPTHLLALAWYMGPGNQQSEENFRWVQHSIDLLFAFAGGGGHRVAFCGSCMEYDWRLEEPFVEDVSPLNAQSEYGAAKAGLYTMYGKLCDRLGLSGAWGRPYFLYGPGENPRRLAADVIISLLEGREALCTHGRQKRDFLHVDDVAAALVAMLWSDHKGALNVGSGTAVPLCDLIGEIGRQTGRGELVRLGARESRPGDPELVEADMSRMAGTVGWTPRYTLKTGIAQTIDWWRAELERTKVS